MANETKHTPGPWQVDPTNALHVKTKAKGYGGGIIATVPDETSHNRDNARLIAAAPELLAALRSAEKVLQELGNSGALDMTRAAIAKAEGRALPNDKGICSVCRQPQPNGYHEHPCE